MSVFGQQYTTSLYCQSTCLAGSPGIFARLIKGTESVDLQIRAEIRNNVYRNVWGFEASSTGQVVPIRSVLSQKSQIHRVPSSLLLRSTLLVII